MSTHRARVVAAVERFSSRAKPCASCGESPAAAGWRAGGLFGHWCASCARKAPGGARVPWEKPAAPPWRGPGGEDAA